MGSRYCYGVCTIFVYVIVLCAFTPLVFQLFSQRRATPSNSSAAAANGTAPIQGAPISGPIQGAPITEPISIDVVCVWHKQCVQLVKDVVRMCNESEWKDWPTNLVRLEGIEQNVWRLSCALLFFVRLLLHTFYVHHVLYGMYAHQIAA